MSTLKMDFGVEFDAEYNGANRFLENCGQSAHFGPLWGPYMGICDILAK